MPRRRAFLAGVLLLLWAKFVDAAEWPATYFSEPIKKHDSVQYSAAQSIANMGVASIKEGTTEHVELMRLTLTGAIIDSTINYNGARGLNIQLEGDTEMTPHYLEATESADYEAGTTSFQLDLYVQTGSNRERGIVFITLENINDNPPVIISPIDCSVKEEESPIETDCKFQVTDADGGACFLDLEVDDDHFSFKLISAKVDYCKDATFVLVVDKKLDYEQYRLHQLRITAKDDGIYNNNGDSIEGYQETTASYVVNVIDIPDEEPVWQVIYPSHTVDEKVEWDLPLHAVDGDYGLNWPIQYSLQCLDLDEDECAFFSIDLDSGVLHGDSINRDKLQKEIFKIQVVATEVPDEEAYPDFPAMSTPNDIVIMVNDINDNEPLIEPKDLTLTHVEESHFSERLWEVSDPDLADNGTFNLWIEGEKSENFLLIPNTGYQKSSITITSIDPKKMDYENPEWRIITLTIVAEELANKTHVTDTTVTIVLEDINDEYPVFEKDTYVWNIEENRELGFTVGRTLATDPDEGDVITYSLTNRLMEIDEEGYITTAVDNAFDYERQTELMFQVVAEDLAGHRSFAEVTIYVEDLNDEQPTLIMPVVRVDVNEHDPNDTPASANIRATDPDTTASLAFEITWDESSAFKNGIEVTEKHLFENSVRIVDAWEENDEWITYVAVADEFAFDFEVFDTMKLQITVIDLETHEDYMDNERASAILTVTLNDINDCFPIFDDDSVNQVLEVTENTPENRMVGSVIATDDDGPEWNQIKYSIEPLEPKELVEDSENPRLVIDERTGRLSTTNNSIDCDVWKTLVFKYKVTATDGENPSHTELTLLIEDTNDEEPEVTAPEGNVIVVNDIYEKTDGILEIACLVGNDIDYTEDFHTISYFIEGRATEKFKLDANRLPHESVCLTADGSELDREEQEYHEIEIMIRDNYKEKIKYNSNEILPVIVQLTLLDINDNPPVFENSGDPTSKPETDLLKGATILTARVTDADINENGEIWCEDKPLVEVVRSNRPQEDIEALFAVETVEKKDYYECNVKATKDFLGYWGVYQLTLTAWDKGDDPNNGTGTYLLTVSNVNLNNPEIIYPFTQETIYLDTDQKVNSELEDIYGKAVRDFSAEDLDDPDNGNGLVSFDLTDDQGIFDIVQLPEDNTVALRMIRKPPDGSRIFSLTLTAEDNGLPRLPADPVDFTVYVINLGAVPEFLQEEYTVQFKENVTGLEQSEKILQAVNLDDELLPNPRPIFYYIIEGSTTIFELDKSTGELTLKEMLDYETTPDHKLELIVLATYDPEPPESTSGNNYGTSAIKIIVEIIDVNDMPPRFVQQLFAGTFSVDHEIGKVVVILEAFDPDTDDSITYEMIPGTLTVDDDSLEQFKYDTSFEVHPETGVVTLNFSPGNRDLQGVFMFRVIAFDDLGKEVEGHSDTADVYVFVVSAAHQVEFFFYNSVDTVEKKQNEMANVFSQVFAYTCTVEKVQEWQFSNDQVESSLVLTHFVDNENKSPVLRNVIESKFLNSETYSTLFTAMEEHSLIFRGFSEAVPEESRSYMTIVLAAACAVLLVLVVVFFLAFIVRTRTLNLRLERLTSKKFGSQDSGLNRDGMAVPGTNLHALEGSNPVWNHDIGQTYDNMSQSSGDSDLIGIEDSPEFGGPGGVDNLAFDPAQHGVYGNPFVIASMVPVDPAAAASFDAGPRRASINPLAAGLDGSGPVDLEELGKPRRISLNPLAAAVDDAFSAVDVFAEADADVDADADAEGDVDADAEGDAGSALGTANFYFQQPKEPSTEL